MIRFIKNNKEFVEYFDVLKKRAEGINKDIIKIVNKIIYDIKHYGDRALREYTKKFDKIEPKQFRISQDEIKKQANKVSSEVFEALNLAAKRIKQFHTHQIEKTWEYKEEGITLGQLVRPLKRVGVYVPGGKASYPSSVLMNVIPAQVAGVKEIALCVPTPNGEINPALMAAIQIVGVNEVYRIGGAQAIGALAYGTESIHKVDKIVGPGNIYVATAKKMVFGIVDIDMIAGPSEILIIADNSAKLEIVAADMLSQAEHDEFASAIVITTSEKLAKEIKTELQKQLSFLSRKKIAEASLKNYGAVILVKTIKEAIEIANTIAPEHLEIITEEPKKLLPYIENAGAIFLGQWTPEPIGDYLAGPNHTLPTGGTARFFSPLGVYHFLKRTSIIKFNKNSFKCFAPFVQILSEIEGLQAHGNTIKIRLKEYNNV